MKLALRFILLFLIFSALFVLPAVLLPIPLGQQGQEDNNPLFLLLVFLVDLVCLIYLIRRLNLWGMKLFFAVVLVFWGLQTFMTQIETWYFREAMPAITDEVLMKLFLNPFITAVTFTPLAMWMMGKWRRPNGDQDHPLSPPSKWKEILALSISYMMIYYLFGFYIAWQFEEVRMFYAGSTALAGFIEQLQQTLRTYPFLFPFQVLRGFFWILFGLPVVLCLKGNRTEKIVACVFMYAVLTSIQLIIDNPFMPAGVRLAHLLEVTTSNGLYGLLIGLMLSRPHNLKAK